MPAIARSAISASNPYLRASNLTRLMR
jgi:hypothetical protein